MSGLTAAPTHYNDFATIDAFIRSLSDEELQSWLDHTSVGEFIDLHRNRYYPIYMNMSSLFRGKRSLNDIQGYSIEAAKLAVWLNHFTERYLSSLAADKLERAAVNSVFRLEGWDFNLIESLLQQGKGLVIASFRFGLAYCLPLELARFGYDLCVPFVTPKYRSVGAELGRLRERLSRGWSFVESQPDIEKVRNIARLEVVDLNGEGATLTFAEALKKGQIMVVFTDGNNGADGPWGGGSRATVDFMGLPCAPKTGMARLATFSGAAILPVISVMKSRHEAKLIFGEPIIPPAGMKREARESFAQIATAKLYDFLAGIVERFPGQWAGVSALHRWRVLPSSDEIVEHRITIQEIAQELRQGKAFGIPEQSSLLPIPAKESEVWVDLSTLRSVKVPPWAHEVLSGLTGTGLNSQWLDRFAANGGSRENVVELLAELCNRKILAMHTEPQPVSG